MKKYNQYEKYSNFNLCESALFDSNGIEENSLPKKYFQN